MQTESTFLHKEPCPACGSRDNLGRYSDGHGHCFGCGYYDAPDGTTQPKQERRVSDKELIPAGPTEPLVKRKITSETCAKWGYSLGKFKGKNVQIAAYRDEAGKVVAQKLRFANKDFLALGNLKEAMPLYGQWLWRDGGKMVVVTEGEIDALTVSQLQNNKWPVVSVPNGAQGAAKAVARALEWLCNFDTVVFMFDNDDPGREAAEECARILPPGRAKIASLPLKDPNDMLVKGRGAEVIDAIWGAKAYRPDGIVTFGDIADEVLKPTEMGLPWFSDTLTNLTYGRRFGEVYCFGAGTGIGKTDFFAQQIEYDVVTLGQPVGLFLFEQQPRESAVRIAGKHAGRLFHIPNAGWEQAELVAATNKLRDLPIYMYDHFGATEWDKVRESIRFLYHAHNVRIFYVDHLTALAAGDDDDERVALERIMSEIGGLVKELDIMIHLISHLATPDGTPHEEGGRVMIRHFKGARAIGFWCHFMFGLERDQQSEDPEERATTTFRVLKDRYTGRATGETFFFGYDRDTGRLFEKALFSPDASTSGKGNDDF